MQWKLQKLLVHVKNAVAAIFTGSFTEWRRQFYNLFAFFFFFFSINFWGLFQFGSLKTSNASKFPGIEFWGAEPRVRRRKKNSTYFVYLLLKTSREQISRFNLKFLVAFTVVVTKTLFRFYWRRLGRVEISTLGVGVRVKQTPSNSPFDSPQLLVRATDGTKLLVKSVCETAPWVSTSYNWPVWKAIVNSPISLKGNSKRISGNPLSPLGAQNKDIGAASQTLLTWLRSTLRHRLPNSSTFWQFSSAVTLAFYICAPEENACDVGNQKTVRL